MALTGIIAEFNPLHNGHKYLIDTAKSNRDTVVAVISGNFVQRGECAVFEKEIRAKSALLCGVDIVAELPVLWSMSTAKNFALGGVWQLHALGCENIIFGSECGDIKKLMTVADILCSDEFDVLLQKYLAEGITFATARELAVAKFTDDANILKNPNDNLGVEYVLAARKLGLNMTFRCVKREGAKHDSSLITNQFVSSSLIREHLIGGDIDFAKRYVPECLHSIINENDIADTSALNNAVLSVLRTKTAKDFEKLPDISEGLHNLLETAIKNSKSVDELQFNIKSKRYTLSRIRRLIFSAFLGFDNSFFMKTPPYVRILGASDKGLNKIPLNAITTVAQINKLTGEAKKVFNNECKATDIFTLALKKPIEPGLEYKRKFLKHLTI